jgi:hypothetical protein
MPNVKKTVSVTERSYYNLRTALQAHITAKFSPKYPNAEVESVETEQSSFVVRNVCGIAGATARI